ncbi:DUF3800 domain-containing protein [Paraclostridium sordellii]|uniref:DUF3800 domain-containing protein n=1 Tax=Paraclostridium sordellii TaxID=1505 RepID=UPI0005E15139|nr:DUF3800 domain-containing protein [Paeniclostridium sordellii]CEN21462.1 Protein of uncharacterised function (DUF3800) [[Clostridium] sordellii] [Paeniclostridium sordellii]
MNEFFIYIDDSGSPGQPVANKFMEPDTTIWAAVILSLENKKYIDEKIEFIMKEIQQELQLSEFHFTEIYSGKNAFKNVDPKIRLEIFESFVQLYNDIRPYVVVTSAGKGTLKNSGFSDSYILKKENGFNFSNPSDYALNALVLIIDEYFAENYKKDHIKLEITIDEGRQKANTKQMLNNFIGTCKELNYKSSANVYGLQFADFIAFSINRIQNNFSKNRSNFDNDFMSIIGNLHLNSNLLMIPISDLNKLNKDFIESFLNNQETVGIETIQHIEKLSNCLSKMQDFISKKT